MYTPPNRLKYTCYVVMNKKTKPVITKSGKNKPYTKITFKPDYKRLKIDKLSEYGNFYDM